MWKLVEEGLAVEVEGWEGSGVGVGVRVRAGCGSYSSVDDLSGVGSTWKVTEVYSELHRSSRSSSTGLIERIHEQ